MSTVKCLFTMEIVVEDGHVCAKHDHACTELVACFGCRGWLHDAGRRFRYDSNQICVYQPGTLHWIHNERAGRQICVGVSGCGVTALAAGVYTVEPDIFAEFERLLELGTATGELVGERRDLLAGLLIVALREALTPEAPPASESRAHAAKEILDEHFTDAVSISELASSLYISPDYLRQLFKQEFGDSPMHYLLRRRIEYAKHLLRETDWPMHKVAAACGIDNPPYFSRLFRKLHNESPSAYRARHPKP